MIPKREELLPEPYPGVPNFRDFGGYRSRHGGRVRQNRLFRSGQLSEVAPAAIPDLLALDFALVADLRYVAERMEEPSPWPEAWADRILAHDGHQSDDEAPHLILLRRTDVGPADCRAVYRQIYEDLPFDPQYQTLFAQILRRLAETDGRALVHCSAGKDRTGIMVALIQHVLGVAREDIWADYALSARSTLLLKAPEFIVSVERRHGVRHKVETMLAMLGAEPDYLEAAFGAMVARCGSVDSYLGAIGIEAANQDAIRERLLA